MNPQIVRGRLARISELADDDEAAHGEEDALYWEVLAAIAQGMCEKPKQCAQLAITSRDIKFARWCA